MGRKTSIVWNHFTIPPLFPKKALCNYCQQLVCRGQANLGTTSLMNHLKRCNEFKASVLGIPKGVSDMMAAAISAADAQLRKISQDESAESCDFALQNDGEIVESDCPNDQSLLLDSAWPGIHCAPGKSVHNIHGIDDAPTLVGRMAAPSRSECNADSSDFNQGPGEYQNDERASVLLYGDISSTSDSNEEPSSSTFNNEGSLINSSVSVGASDLVHYASSNSSVDFLYGGIMLHNLYQQYKSGKFCDIRIIPQKMSTNEVIISETGKVTRKNISYSSKDDGIISVHSCVLGAVSRKVNSFVEMGCTTIHLKKGGRDSVKGLMEIVYTGKLLKLRLYSENQLMEILEVARFLEVDLAVQYLMREIPEGRHIRPRSNVEKLIDERMQTLKTAPSYLTPSAAAAVTMHNLCRPTTSLNTGCNSMPKEGARQERIIECSQRKRKSSDSISEMTNNQHSDHGMNTPHLSKSMNLLNSLGMASTLQIVNKRRKYAVHEMGSEQDDTIAKENNEIYKTCQPDTLIKSEAMSSPLCYSNSNPTKSPAQIKPLGEFDIE